MSDYLQRFGKRLLTSVPAATEEAFLAVTDPVGGVKTAATQAEKNLLSYYWLPQGSERLHNDLKSFFLNRAASPEWAADLTVDALSMLLAKKAPGLSAIRGDDNAVASKFVIQQIANGYKQPPALGTRAVERLDEGYNALAKAGEKDSRTAGFRTFWNTLK